MSIKRKCPNCDFPIMTKANKTRTINEKIVRIWFCAECENTWELDEEEED